MAAASTRVMLLAIINGQDCSNTPYSSHSATPSVNALYMPSEIPLTSRVLKLCQACGMKLAVVSIINHPNAAAARPAQEALIDWAVKEGSKEAAK